MPITSSSNKFPRSKALSQTDAPTLETLEQIGQKFGVIKIESIEAPLLTARQEAEHNVPVEVEYIPHLHAKARHDDADEVEEDRFLTVEEILTQNSGDGWAILAAKLVINELLTRQAQSTLCVARWKRCGQARSFDERPGFCDFSADIQLAAKRALSKPLYRVFEWALAGNFENWMTVPAKVRRAVLQRLGDEVLRRNIVCKGRTSQYWNDGFRKRGYALAKAA